MIKQLTSLTFLLSHTTCMSFLLFFSNFFLEWTDSLLKIHVVLTTIYNFILSFLEGTIDSLNRTRGKQNLYYITNDWYTCFLVFCVTIQKRKVKWLQR